MPTALSMLMRDSVLQIGTALANLGAVDAFELRTFPYKFVWFPNPGKPSIRVKYDGIADDSRNGPPVVNSPASLRFEVQIVHPTYGPPDAVPQVEDGIEYAQMRVLDGTSTFYETLQDDPSLNNLVIDTVVAGSITGELVVNDTDYYGEEIIVVCNLY